MDVAKLWSSLLANCAIGTANVCTIPTTYFVQGSADVHLVGYTNESNSSGDDSNVFRGEEAEAEECSDVNDVGEDRDEEEVDEDDEGDRIEAEADAECEDQNAVQEVGDAPPSKRTTKIQRNRYSREEYRCTMCPYTCTTEKAFLKHLRGCESNKEAEKEFSLSCPICGKDRKGEQLLALHVKKHKDNKHFCCDICKFKTLQLKKLIQHRRMHTGERPHLCPFCSYRSARRDNLRSHARRVHKKDNLPCDTFTPRSMLLTPTKAK